MYIKDKFLSVAILILITLAYSCKSSKALPDPAPSADPGTWILKYDRGPCFGYCPVYTFYILEDHHGLVQVKANLLTPGWYYAGLDQKEVDELLKMLESDRYWHPDLTDQPNISDQPSHHLEYKHPSGLRTLDIQSQYNTDLSDLFRKLNHIVEEARWDTTSLRPPGELNTASMNLIVQLKEGIDPGTWIKKYSSFGARINRKISPNQTYYLVSKDPAKGSPNDFYQTLKHDPDLIGVQFDDETVKRR